MSVVALDIGGSHVTAAVVNVHERMLLPPGAVTVHVAHDSPAQLLVDRWAQAALRAARQAGVDRVTHVGIAMPSPFDFERGVSLHRHKFARLHGHAVGQALGAAWAGSALTNARPVFANDADLFALGEAWAGGGRGHERVLGVTLGTGLGSGFISQGRVVTDGPGVPNGGEIWNLPYLGGIAEDHVSARAVSAAYAGLAGEPLPLADIARRAQTGDDHARQAWTQFGSHLTQALAPVVESFRPDVVVLGGNVSRAWPLFRAPLQARFGALCQPSALLDVAALLGAAAYAAGTGLTAHT